MSTPPQIDPHQALYQSKGAVISLQQLLIQRHAAKIVEYVPYNRSIAGISGLHMSKMRGRGIDFEEFRPYQQGDDIRTIDWRVTARTGKPFTKVFREERERPVIIAVDQSSSMYFGSQVAFKSVIAAQAAAIFCWMAIDNGDRVGGLVYSDYDHALVRPKRSRRSALHLLNQIQSYNSRLTDQANRKARQGNVPGQTGLAGALGQIRRITKPGSTLYILSDFTTLDEIAMQYLYQLSRHNNVVCCFVYDALEENLPVPGFYSITDGQNKGTLNSFSQKARRTYQQNFQDRMESLQSELVRLQIPFLKLRTNQLVVEQIRQWTAQTL
ncbi:MAG: DUF58 domain-containing protein [Gammaproteobacteria bacterium]|nr:DUF58 domain-containing protein [Gammaproteobacteria bacterium]MDP2139208.1 DUF58 domain-containing protein [Gammaproteobacteria bacterium]MDP2349023.1 DUF58 domain-containing protein [Gammaproteobacteria bacterium]